MVTSPGNGVNLCVLEVPRLNELIQRFSLHKVGCPVYSQDWHIFKDLICLKDLIASIERPSILMKYIGETLVHRGAPERSEPKFRIHVPHVFLRVL